ncbi:hypothetical protein LCGC14_1101550 [marine sediment metagenome]|uniref:Pyrrolo-quinoline quinone repeat domain-containing protein n=1 Tax=marine sediment metagenome TaxID=412755 RepID=A0A0F9M997_9ZZZZ
MDIGAYFASFDGIPSGIQGSWPRFRGADFDNISKEKIRLTSSWGDAGPDILWSIDLGEGHAAPVVSNGRVYILDYDEDERADVLRCFSFDDGTEIWRRGYELRVKRNHGMSRTVPAVTDKYVVTIGPKCHVMCVDAVSGDFRWGIDLEREYGAEVPLWYTGQCPLIDDSLAVIAVGGRSLIIAVDCETGEVVWEVPNPNDWKMSHSSIMPFFIQGKKMYVYCALGGIIGISAEKETAGEILFETNLWDRTVIAPSPIHIGDGRIFVTAGYGAGSMMLKLNFEDGSFSAESLQELKPGEGIASEQQTPVFYKGHLFSLLPKDAGPLRNQFVCYHPDDCSQILWSSGKTNRFGLGPYIVADDKFFILSDDGILTILKVSTREYVQLARAKVLDGVDAWGPLALVSGRLLARDSRRLVCIDLRAGF